MNLQTILPKKSEGDIWPILYKEAAEEAAKEPILASYLHAIVLNHKTLEDALAFHLAGKLSGPSLQPMLMREVVDEAFRESPSISKNIRADLKAIFERDPAAYNYLEPFLNFKGYHALQSYRVAH